MEILEKIFGDVFVIRPKVHKDHRGFFLESYHQENLKKLGIRDSFIQDNHSFSKDAGTIRGLHFQSPPMAQSKLVRVISGRILDFVVDLRPSSPTYKMNFKIELNDENCLMLYIPPGMAHGLITLSANCHVVYKVNQYYSKECNNGILWNDPDLNIDWCNKKPIISDQDLSWKNLRETRTGFESI